MGTESSTPSQKSRLQASFTSREGELAGAVSVKLKHKQSSSNDWRVYMPDKAGAIRLKAMGIRQAWTEWSQRGWAFHCYNSPLLLFIPQSPGSVKRERQLLRWSQICLSIVPLSSGSYNLTRPLLPQCSLSLRGGISGCSVCKQRPQQWQTQQQHRIPIP